MLVADRPGTGVAATGPAAAPVEVFVQSVAGLNAALAEAAAAASRNWPADGVVALVGDLPALRPDELAAALAAAAKQPRSFVADHTGAGTTLLAAAPGTALEPRFGAGSARRHRAIATPLPAGAGLRHDVDTAADLAAAAAVGLGPATARHTADALPWLAPDGAPAVDGSDADRSPREGMMSA